MAKKEAKPVVVQEPEVEEKGGKPWIIWVVLGVISFVLLMAVLHMSGALQGPEEALYNSTKKTPVISFFTKPLHKEDWKEVLSPDQAIDAKQIYAKLERAEGQIDSVKESLKQIPELAMNLEDIQTNMEKVNKALKELTEGEFEPAETRAETGGGTVAMAAPGSIQEALGSAHGTGTSAGTGVSTGDNYRLVSKIFEKLPADTAVDILNNLTDDEKVSILSSMKENTVADILAAFDPAKSALLARMLAKAKS